MARIGLPLPFQYRKNPHAEAARRYHIDWLCRMGLLTPGAAVDAYLRHMLPEIMALCFPQLDEPGLALATDASAVSGVFDDLIASRAQSAGDVARFHSRFASVVADQSPPEDPLGRAWYDVWARQQQGKSAWWCQQSRARGLEFLAANVEEAAAKRNRCLPDLETYTNLRRRSVAAHLMLDWAEAGGHFEVPARFITSPLITSMTELCGDILGHSNDVASLEREEAAGDTDNPVLILQRQRQTTQAQAIHEVRARAERL
jgi:hypothetical protein